MSARLRTTMVSAAVAALAAVPLPAAPAAPPAAPAATPAPLTAADPVACAATVLGPCAQPLPTSTVPPADLAEAPPPAGPAVPVLLARPVPPGTPAAGTVRCPSYTGRVVLGYPGAAGYGYWAWRVSYPVPVGSWHYGPWLAYDGRAWSAYLFGLWFGVDGAATWPGSPGTAVEGWWFDHGTGRWTRLGECTPSAPVSAPSSPRTP